MNTMRTVVRLGLSGQSLRLNSVQLFRIVLVHAAASGLLATALISGAAGQEFFAVRNQKKQKWPAAEANRIYLLASQAVEREFRLTHPLRPKFTLVLGYDIDQVDGNSGELRLAKWNRRLFADGVILFCVDQMLTPEVRDRLQQRTLLAVDAIVNVDEGKARERDGTAAATPAVSAEAKTQAARP